MPEISEQDFAALAAQVASLSSALAVARRRIDDLEEGMTDHLGLDWGESLVDANSPHPNISANTIESGGGAVRQDRNGMQVYVPTNTNLSGSQSIWFVPSLLPDPLNQVTDYLQIEGYIDPGFDDALNLAAISTNADATKTLVEVFSGGNSGNNNGFFRVSFDGNGSGQTYGAPFLCTPHTVALEEVVKLTGDITPGQITANQNDYAPTGLSTASILRLSTDAARDLTGLTGGSDGRVLLIFNVGSFNIVLKDESASSTAANRFALNGDITLQPDNSTGLWYDSTSSRWRAF